MKQIVSHPQIGKIELLPNRRCKGIRYSVSAKGARISFNPIYVDRVLPLSPDKVEWFTKNLQTMLQKSGCHIYRAETQLQTLSFTLMFAEEPKLIDNLSARLCNNVLTVRYPSGFVFDDNKNQFAIKNIIKHFLVAEAKRLLPERLHMIAQMYGFEYKSTRITTAHTRWGSCNVLGNISLSAYMLLLPEHLIDLVLVHELCHTREMNHSANFYAQLERVFPNHIALNMELKTKSLEVNRWI